MGNDLEERLNNWKACYKDKPQYNRAKSLEGGYSEPVITKEILKQLEKQGLSQEVFERPIPRIRADSIDAKLVEEAVIKLPLKHKLVLVCQYMYPYLLINNGFNRVCHKIGISRKAEVFDDYLKQAKHMVENLLQNKLAQNRK